METLRLLSTLLPLALTSGINLYATVLMVGLSIRLGWVANPPTALEPLSSLVVLIIAGVFYVLEFLADKIPAVDNVWDMIHTFIRPFGAALMSFAVVVQMDGVAAVAAALVAGGIALVSHSTKASTRLLVNVASPAEAVSNVALSLAEDVGAGVLAFLALRFPYAALGLGLLALALMILLVPRLLGWGWFNVRAFVARLKGLVAQVEESELLPSEHLAALAHRVPGLSGRCFAQGVPGAGGQAGYLCLDEEALAFTYRGWLGNKAWRIERSQVLAAYVRQRFFFDQLELHFRAGKRMKKVRFIFLKDRTPLLELFARQLNAQLVR